MRIIERWNKNKLYSVAVIVVEAAVFIFFLLNDICVSILVLSFEFAFIPFACAECAMHTNRSASAFVSTAHRILTNKTTNSLYFSVLHMRRTTSNQSSARTRQRRRAYETKKEERKKPTQTTQECRASIEALNRIEYISFCVNRFLFSIFWFIWMSPTNRRHTIFVRFV